MINSCAKSVMPLSANLYSTGKRERENTPETTGAAKNAEKFYCKACFRDGKTVDQSPDDERYCQACYDFLKEEAERTSSTAAWVPVGCHVVTPERDKGSITMGGVTVNINEKIRVLNGQGYSTRAIARELQQLGHNISHMTVARSLRSEY